MSFDVYSYDNTVWFNLEEDGANYVINLKEKTYNCPYIFYEELKYDDIESALLEIEKHYLEYDF